MSKTVYDLRRDELEELRESYYYQLLYDDEEVLFPLSNIDNKNANYEMPDDIPDDVIFEHFNGIHFVADDFFCNCGDNIFVDDIEKMYDFTRMTKADFLKSYSYLSEAEYDATKTVWDEWHTDEEISIEAVHAWRMAHYGYDCDND